MELYGNVFEKFENLKNSPFHTEYIKSLKEYYDIHHTEEVPQIDYDVFSEYFESGSRQNFSKKFYYPRKRMAAAATLFIYYRDEKYITEICNMMWIILSEMTWAAPAHLTDVDPSDYRRAIDLMASETAFQLSEIIYVLKYYLPERLIKAAKSEIEDRVLNPFENKSFYWERKTNNWSAVCGGAVGMAFMLTAPERFPKVQNRLLKAMEYFLSSYGEDGCCLEGAGYWSYGFGHYMYFADMLYRFTDGKTDIRHSKKLDNIVLYLQRVVLRGNFIASFSDGKRELQLSNAGLACYIYDNYKGVESMPQLLSKDFGINEGRFDDCLRAFLWWDPEYLKKRPEKEQFFYMADGQWYIVKKQAYSFGAKAGNNDEPHNHNDVGSFVFVGDNGQYLADLGAMEYNKYTFSDKRFTLFQNSSEGHSLPIVDGRVQLFGSNYAGQVLRADEECFYMEIQDAYGENMPRIERRFDIKTNGVVLTDTFSDFESHTVTERFISIKEPVLDGDVIRIEDCEIRAGSTPKIWQKKLINRHYQEETVYIMDFTPEKSKFKLEMTVIKR